MKLILAVILLAVVYSVQRYLYSKYWDKGLDTEVRFSRDYIECGESAELIEVVTNDKTLPLPVFHMKFSVDKSLIFNDRANSQITDLYHKNELFSILGHQKITRKLEFVGSARGVVSINNASILVKDFFLTEVYACKMEHSDVIYIFPKKIGTDEFKLFFRGILGEIETRRSVVEDSLTFRGIREYQPFDAYRSINWKQSAKAHELMVNMYGYTTDSRVRILLNLDNNYMIEKNKLLEEAISLVSSMARDLLKEGIMVSVMTNGVGLNGEPLAEVGEGADLNHSITIDRMLSEITGSTGKDVFLEQVKNEIGHLQRDTLYLVVSPYGKSDLTDLLDKVVSSQGTVSLIVPCYDEYPYVSDRPYAVSWEVPLNV